MERIMIEGPEVTIEKQENNLINITYADGKKEEGLEPRRLFPVQDADHYITLLDEDGVEHAIIRDMKKLREDSRKVIEASLGDYYLVPHITRIISFSGFCLSV